MFYGLTPQVVIVWRSLGDGYLSVLITKSGLFLSQSVRQHRLTSISGWRSVRLLTLTLDESLDSSIVAAFLPLLSQNLVAMLLVVVVLICQLALLSRQIFLAVTLSPHRVALGSRHIPTML